jgi:hypothetical protein
MFRNEPKFRFTNSVSTLFFRVDGIVTQVLLNVAFYTVFKERDLVNKILSRAQDSLHTSILLDGR